MENLVEYIGILLFLVGSTRLIMKEKKVVISVYGKEIQVGLIIPFIIAIIGFYMVTIHSLNDLESKLYGFTYICIIYICLRIIYKMTLHKEVKIITGQVG